jgi:uncharacterized protein YdeI (YjbR/CyaY-like superfamily)
MPKTDKRVDAYVANAADFARPILERLRAIVHEGCPDCEETLKWGHPSFMYNGILCGMIAFKERCALHFWKSSLLSPNGENDPEWQALLYQMKTVSDIPPKKTLLPLIKKAMEQNETGAKVPKAPPKAKKELLMPDVFMSAIKKNKKALAAFDKFSPSHKREYVEWITDAKAEATRDRRIAQAVEWMAEGKPRNWKYM